MAHDRLMTRAPLIAAGGTHSSFPIFLEYNFSLGLLRLALKVM